MIDPAFLTLQAMIVTAFALGARHALDADHLSVVDAVARRDALIRPWSARLAGLFFSLGHVLVVAGIAVPASLFLDRHYAPPAWLSLTGVAISASALLLLGLVNVRAACRPATAQAVAVSGWKSRWLKPGQGGMLVMLTGALFALSFDTVAIALGIGIGGQWLGGWHWALLGCGAFGIGMMLVGTANGALTVQLLRSADHRAALVSRAMTMTIGLINLALGLLGIGALLLPRLDQWREEHGLATSGAVIALCLIAFAVSLLAHWMRGSRQALSARG
jgi:high-affinity nickel-transport protein